MILVKSSDLFSLKDIYTLVIEQFNLDIIKRLFVRHVRHEFSPEVIEHLKPKINNATSKRRLLTASCPSLDLSFTTNKTAKAKHYWLR